MSPPLFPPARSATAARALGLALLAVLACGGEEPEPEPIVRPVKVFEVTGPSAGRTREYAGEIRAAQHADMAFEVPGRIVSFLVKEGDPVVEGQELARLDPRDYQAQLDADLAKLQQAETELKRRRYLFEQGVGPKVDVERGERNVKVLDAEVAQSRKAVEDTVLRAPFDGVMARKLVEDFQNVQAKEPVLILQDDSRLKIKVNVPERDIAQGRREELDLAAITRRLEPRVVVSSLPDREFPAVLTELATTADPSTRTFEATFTFDRPATQSVLPGMTAKVRVRTRTPSRVFTEASRTGGTGETGATSAAGGIQVPAQAVRADAEGRSFVWVVDPQTQAVSRRIVEVGELTGDEVVVHGGLAPGDRVAISGVTQLREGMRVRPLEP